MAAQPPALDPTPPQRRQMKVLYWIAAAALTVAIALEFVDPPLDYMKLGSRVALLAALILLATARPAETRGKKTLIYALVIVAAVLLVARLAR
jgi:uncharacterized membrane protein